MNKTQQVTNMCRLAQSPREQGERQTLGGGQIRARRTAEYRPCVPGDFPQCDGPKREASRRAS